jgi:hypothetical protein
VRGPVLATDRSADALTVVCSVSVLFALAGSLSEAALVTVAVFSLSVPCGMPASAV